jgi:hypothetical protein
MSVAPDRETINDRKQRGAAFGKQIIVLSRTVFPFPQYSRGDQFFQPSAKNGLRNIQMREEVIEATNAQKTVANDQQRPPFAHEFERSGDRTVLQFVVVTKCHESFLPRQWGEVLVGEAAVVLRVPDDRPCALDVEEPKYVQPSNCLMYSSYLSLAKSKSSIRPNDACNT